MPTKEEVGQRVRLARFRRDMTLKEVANRSGMSATHISEIERGKTSPTIGAQGQKDGVLVRRGRTHGQHGAADREPTLGDVGRCTKGDGAR